MTVQSQEILLVDGRARWMQSQPLDPWLSARGISARQFSEGSCTSLYRGYKGVWEIANDRLWLIGLLDYRDEPMDPAPMLDGARLPIPAAWFTGHLELPEGAVLSFWRYYWGADRAFRLRLYLREGRVVRQRRDDMRPLLRRRFDAFVAEEPDWSRLLLSTAFTRGEPLGGLTDPGLACLGRPDVLELAAIAGHRDPGAPEADEDDVDPEYLARVMRAAVRAPREVETGRPSIACAAAA